ncbi:hypothetical protein BJ170DRAFT_645973 [Xylariales sp. AK1849]|nr:hypothetical protein BJ170DRAFT_645973 [Xylariales sp. AK1849]
MDPFLILALAILTILIPSVTALNLNVTAIATNNGGSTLECWQLGSPFTQSSQAGTSGTAFALLSEVANVSYVVIPPNFDGGLHNAPYHQWVVFISGLAYITLPEDSSTSAYISGGEFGLIFAADTADFSRQGHRTQYPGITETIALQIPTKDGRVPAREVLHGGPCTANEVSGIRG